MKNIIKTIKLKIQFYLYRRYFLKQGFNKLDAENIAKNVIEINNLK